jgi:hypothetical protein
MVGLSMALTIALCIGSFVWIYAQVEPVIGDFVDAATVGPTTVSQATEESVVNEDATDVPEDEQTPEPQSEVPTEDSNVVDPSANDPSPTPTPEDQFKATHVISAEVPINLRPGPGVGSGDPVGNSLAPGTELQYLDKTQPSQDPNADGDTAWMNFRLEDGREGWIRQIDVDSVNAGQ